MLTVETLLMDFAKQGEFPRTSSLYSLSGYNIQTLHIPNSSLTKPKEYKGIIQDQSVKLICQCIF
jgi:hypothetical protein